jgi:outer membrane protein OmpA-like peptidoglycan-associated protein
MKTLTARFRAAALAAALAGCVSALPARAGETTEERAQASKQSNLGGVTGLALGAAAGGPVGAVFGAAAGVVLGDRYHRQSQSAAALKAELGESEAQRSRLQQSVAQLDRSLAQSQARGQELDQALQHTDQLGLDVSFRTDDDSIALQQIPPLLKLGALALAVPRAQLRVAGYADPRGSDGYNNALSLRRAQAVAAVLATAGVPAERLVLEAHGKSEADCGDGDLDAYALERRDTVRLMLPGSDQVARRE